MSNNFSKAEVKPPGRALLTRIIFRLNLSQPQIETLLYVYSVHDDKDKLEEADVLYFRRSFNLVYP